jgi:hypothetical protein
MPEAAIDEDCNTPRPKDDVGCNPYTIDGQHDILSKSETAAMEQ